MTLSLVSAAFRANGDIPVRYTCEGDDVSPPLAWSGIPSGTRSLALIVDDPDAPDPKDPKMVWVHWVLYNIPVDTGGLPEAVAPARCRGARAKAATAGIDPATAGRARQSAGIVTSTSSTRSTPNCPTSGGRTGLRWRER